MACWVNERRLWESLMEMAQIGGTPNGGCCRLALSDEDRRGRDLFVRWCQEAGCEVSVDIMGNLFARRAGRDSGRAAVVMGSHLDTQPRGGKFDGVFGVLAGLEVIRTLNDRDITTEVPLEIAVWTNEEGARFAPPMLASGVFSGAFSLDYGLSRTDAEGVTLGAALNQIGYDGALPCGERAMDAFFEAHIEQGPILEANDNTIGVVTGVQGSRWYEVTLTGQDAHSGSTPMLGRRDALIGGAEFIGDIESLALDYSPHAVATVGHLDVAPNSHNTIAGQVFLTVDMRHPEITIQDEMEERLYHCVQDIAKRRNLKADVTQIVDTPPVQFDPDCVGIVRKAAAELGYRHQDIVSGAGHDACYLSRVTPTAMIFVPCAGGLSHNERESAEAGDLAAGCQVLLGAVLRRANKIS